MSRKKYKCLNCRNIFEDKHYSKIRKFCSVGCLRKYKNVHKIDNRKAIKCKQCNKPFKIYIRKFKNPTFCSRDCFTKYRNINSRKVKIKCKLCKKNIKVFPSDRIYNIKFCSKTCDGLNRRKLPSNKILKRLYAKERLSVSDIAKKYNVGKNPVYVLLRNLNVEFFYNKVSEPQKKLFNIIKNIYPNAIMEYKMKGKNNRPIFLDIAIISKMLNIEYDGFYWHKNRLDKDKERDNYLKSLGWKVKRIKGSTGTIDDIKEDEVLGMLRGIQ